MCRESLFRGSVENKSYDFMAFYSSNDILFLYVVAGTKNYEVKRNFPLDEEDEHPYFC